MSDLGLSGLTDDQLLSLLAEVTQELAVRDPLVQRAAQATVLKIAAKRDLFMAEAKKQIEHAKQLYVDNLRVWVRGEVDRRIQAGEINIPGMVGSRQEADLIVQFEKKQIDELKKSLNAANGGDMAFTISFSQGTLKAQYHSGGRDWDTTRNLGWTQVAAGVRKAVLNAFGIPES